MEAARTLGLGRVQPKHRLPAVGGARDRKRRATRRSSRRGALARAMEWLTADADIRRGGLAAGSDLGGAIFHLRRPAGFAATVAFIQESAAQARRELDEERQTAERAQQQAVERAQAAELAAKQARVEVFWLA